MLPEPAGWWLEIPFGQKFASEPSMRATVSRDVSIDIQLIANLDGGFNDNVGVTTTKVNMNSPQNVGINLTQSVLFK